MHFRPKKRKVCNELGENTCMSVFHKERKFTIETPSFPAEKKNVVNFYWGGENLVPGKKAKHKRVLIFIVRTTFYRKAQAGVCRR